MKKYIIGILLLIIALGTFLYWAKARPMLTVVNGYAAKCMCSNVFLTDRPQDEIENIDLELLPVHPSIKVNKEEKYVESSVYGLAKRRAEFRDDLGCVLINGKDDYHVSYTDSEHATYPDTLYPYGNQVIDPTRENMPSDVDYDKLQAAIDYAFDADGAYTDKKTRAVVVLYKDTLIAERYGQGHKRDTRILGWSMTKSIVNALIGIVFQDKIKRTSITNELFPEWTDDRKFITLNSLMRMNSGLEWDERYDVYTDATEMLYDSDNTYKKGLSAPYSKPEGTVWKYSSGTTNILSGWIRNQFDSDQEYYDFLHHRLLNRIGMDDAIVETDESGHLIGSSYGYATALDWARFGTLYLRNGVWNGDRVLPDDWIKFTTIPAEGSEGGYGAQFWLNQDSEFPDVPKDMYAASGFQGQKVAIIPSKDLVIVRLGFNSDFDFNGFLGKIVDAVK